MQKSLSAQITDSKAQKNAGHVAPAFLVLLSVISYLSYSF
ncbi:hypothetical protein HMPREF0765_2913 [Sphingobacterium spiritivorum ATCC 33300]|uniref:Uncharacterized protein n=1 Tax=Sphingobacterium spiritivorum ATCC 33300 TaxID=525372 RepID=C2G007_SPHSI|nr:hypothetical protein HMPREF0765_2913 [Sphingobacterium spiritivorum ATCC 33300]